MDTVYERIEYNTKVLICGLICLCVYVIFSVYFIGYSYNQAFLVYNQKLDAILEKISLSKSTDSRETIDITTKNESSDTVFATL
jgi:hypothetical protein